MSPFMIFVVFDVLITTLAVNNCTNCSFVPLFTVALFSYFVLRALTRLVCV